MRRILILALYFAMGHNSAMAFSGRFSAELSPSYATNRLYNRIKPVLYDKGGAMALHFGCAYHLVLQEHCNLSLGLSYALSRMQVARDATDSLSCIDEGYSLHYLWIPVLCRFYTSEVMLDTSIYFKLGVIPSINLPSRPITPADSGSSAVLTKRPFGFFILLGGGVKYDFSLTNSLVLSLSYCWDVPGIMYTKDTNNCYCYNNFVCVDLCFLF